MKTKEYNKQYHTGYRIKNREIIHEKARITRDSKMDGIKKISNGKTVKKLKDAVNYKNKGHFFKTCDFCKYSSFERKETIDKEFYYCSKISEGEKIHVSMFGFCDLWERFEEKEGK